MKKFVVLLLSKWYALNVADHEEFVEDYTFTGDDLIITSQSPELLRLIFNTKCYKQLYNILDFESIDKQMSQQGKEFGAAKRWRLSESLKHHRVIPDDFKVSDANVKEFLRNWATLYSELIEQNSTERNRLEQVETQVNAIIYTAQFRGIRIDFEMARNLCKALDRKIYAIKNRLQHEFKIFNPDSLSQKTAYLKERNIEVVKSPLFAFKSKRNEDAGARLFYDLIRNQNDQDSMLFMLSVLGGYKRAHPKYQGFGTISSRITLKEPSFQNLKKENRGIVIADDNYRLFYIDYQQFEASILASFSKDEKLIKLIAKDIYSDIAEKLLGQKTLRSDAKIIFYRFIYGDKSLEVEKQQYFNQFPELMKFKASVEAQIVDSGSVGSSNGNMRVRSDKDFGWALSHVIQSNASLIYKKALIRTQAEVPKAKFLIPMHDATLYQLPKTEYDNISKKIEQIYQEEFTKICPEIIPKMSKYDTFIGT